jgi:hypothetical protein
MSNRTDLRDALIAVLAIAILAAAIPSAPLAAQAKTKAKAPAAKDTDPYAGLSLGAFKLRPIGPALTSGRISDFAVRPGKRHEFFVASASGGVWKTVNAGTTFTPVFDAQGSTPSAASSSIPTTRTSSGSGRARTTTSGASPTVTASTSPTTAEPPGKTSASRPPSTSG